MINGTSGMPNFSAMFTATDPSRAVNAPDRVHLFVEEAKQEDDYDARSDKAGIFLNRLEGAIETAEERLCQNQCNAHGNEGGYATNGHIVRFALRRLLRFIQVPS